MLGNSIRKIRKSKRLTMQQLADKSGYTRNQVHRIETNKQAPKITTVIALADALEVSIDELVGRKFKLKPVERFPFDSCPKCGRVVNKSQKHCPDCGQALDWSDAE